MRFWWIFLLYAVPASAQNRELIPNGGFEDENICTEYSRNCAPAAWIASSLRANYYFYDSLWSHEGTHFVGLIAGSIVRPGMRNFIRTQLRCRLKEGKEYLLEFYVRANNPILDSIAIYFSYDDFLFNRRPFSDIHPQLWAKNGMDSNKHDPAKWQRVRLNYLATGDEQFICIGNFRRTDQPGIRHTEFEHYYYFFVDDVSLIPEDPHELLCSEWKQNEQDIYAVHERHQMLESKIFYYRHDPPTPPRMDQTINQTIDSFTVPDLFFSSGSFQLDRKAGALLDSFCLRAAPLQIDSLIVEGHTDSVGKLQNNMVLSSNRARTVADFLERKISIGPDKTIIRYYASARPIASNGTEEGRRKNRRVEIYLYSHH